MPEEPDYRNRTRSRLREILKDAASQPPLFIAVEMREIGPNAIADLRIRWRGHPKLPEPDELQAAILQLLYARGLTREKDVVGQLREFFSDSSIRRRLKGLVVLGLVRHRTRTPRGYDLMPELRIMADCA
jgi:hypothetical protein